MRLRSWIFLLALLMGAGTVYAVEGTSDGAGPAAMPAGEEIGRTCA
ncbi:MAG TPA: hypothetical protein PLY40_00085 [Bacillota bacterium]|nr:hypothetical protein [Bacillota bacterium]